MKLNIHKEEMVWYNIKHCIRDSFERSRNIGENFNRKEIDVAACLSNKGIYRRK